jgi:hypothetical protein
MYATSAKNELLQYTKPIVGWAFWSAVTPAFKRTPSEIWDLILSEFCSDEFQAKTMPLICKSMYLVSHDESSFWRGKCQNKFGLEVQKSKDISWKQLYFLGKLYNTS